MPPPLDLGAAEQGPSPRRGLDPPMELAMLPPSPCSPPMEVAMLPPSPCSPPMEVAMLAVMARLELGAAEAMAQLESPSESDRVL